MVDVVPGVFFQGEVLDVDGYRNCLEVADGRLYEFLAPAGHGYVLLREEGSEVLRRGDPIVFRVFRRNDGLDRVSALRFCGGRDASEVCDYVAEFHPIVEEGDFLYAISPISLPFTDLFEYISSMTGVLPPHRVRSIFMQIVMGLDSLHRRGIHHRDISLEAILVSGDEDNLLCLLYENESAVRMLLYQQSGNATRAYDQQLAPYGKRPYMAPELFNMQSLCNGVHTDVWALGVVLFILLTGHPLFKCANRTDPAFRAVTADNRGLRNLLQWWQIDMEHDALCLVEHLLAPNPLDRPSCYDIAHSAFLAPLRHEWDRYEGGYRFRRRKNYLMFLKHWGLLGNVMVRHHESSVQSRVLGNADLQRVIASYL